MQRQFHRSLRKYWPFRAIEETWRVARGGFRLPALPVNTPELGAFVYLSHCSGYLPSGSIKSVARIRLRDMPAGCYRLLVIRRKVCANVDRSLPVAKISLRVSKPR